MLVPVRCKDRGGFLLLGSRPVDVKPGWRGFVSVQTFINTPFLESAPEIEALYRPIHDDDLVVLEE